ncbi:MAG TPA: STAS domain-containing protein [Spirochaetota bacterium]|nr:STAS domain-containing protein [Spirochaetota bacterium]
MRKRGANPISFVILENIDKSTVTIELGEAIVLNNESFYDELASVVKKSDRRHVVLDFSRVEIIDDCGLQAVTRLVERYGRKGYSFALRNPRRAILKLLVFRDMVDRIDIRFTDDYRP